MFEIPGMPGGNVGMINISEMLGKAFAGGKGVKKRMAVKDSYAQLITEEADKLLDLEQIKAEAGVAGRKPWHRLPRRDRQDRALEPARRRRRLP